MMNFLLSEVSFTCCLNSEVAGTHLSETCLAIAKIHESIGGRPNISAHNAPSSWRDKSGGSVYEAIAQISKSNKDISSLILGYLSTSNISPFFESVPEDYRRSNEVITEHQGAHEELLTCLLFQWQLLSVGFGSPYDKRHIDLLLSTIDANIEVTSKKEQVGNVSKVCHADSAVEMLAADSFNSMTTTNCAERLKFVFPHLRFTESATNQLVEFNEGDASAIFSRLRDLNATAHSWRLLKLPFPNWQCNVTRESRSTMDNPKERAKRIFKNSQGVDELFELHAKIGGNRIHLLVIHDELIFEIGYIGVHL